MNLRPLHDNVILRRIDPDEKIGSLYVPEIAKEKTHLAEVVAIGPGKLLDSGEWRTIDIKVGEVVVVSRWAGNEIEFEGAPYLVCRSDSDVILGVIDPDEPQAKAAEAAD